jgi:uncharacterized protein
MKRFFVQAIMTDSESPNSSTLYLLNKKSKLLLPVEINKESAKALTLAQQNIPTPRPHIHDTIRRLIASLNGKVAGITINMYRDGIFYSYIRVKNGNKYYDIDSKATDAIAIAIRSNAPIYIEDDVIQGVGIKITQELLDRSLN